MRNATRAAERAADTAGRSADITERGLVVTQRAYVFARGFDSAINLNELNRITGYTFRAMVENFGLTPATNVESNIDHQSFPMIENREPQFVGDFRGTSVGNLPPHGKGATNYHFITLEEMTGNWLNQTDIYIWARVQYRDTFDPDILHHHEQCARVEVIHDPRVIPAGGTPYVTFRTYGPQNTVG